TVHPVTARRASISAVALTVAAVGLILLMLMFAARSGPERIFTGPLHDPNIRPIAPSYTPPTIAPRPRGQHGDGLFHSNPVFTAIGWVLRIAVAILVLWLLYRGARRVVEGLRDVRRRPKRAK